MIITPMLVLTLLAAQPAAGDLRDLLASYELGPEQLETFVDQQPITPFEQEVLLRLLHRLPRIPARFLFPEAGQRLEPSEIPDDSRGMRGRPLQLRGRAIRVERLDLPPEQANRLEFTHYFRVVLQLADGMQAEIFARQIPQPWQNSEAVHEASGAAGVLLKWNEAEPRQLVVAAERLEWYPERAPAGSQLSADQLQLAELGMDLALLEGVNQRHGRPLESSDKAAFYAMLAAVQRADPASLTPHAEDPPLSKLLLEPSTFQGELFQVRGVVRRVTRVVVDDPDLRQRFGVEHYFQMDVFLPLGDEVIRLADEKGSADAPEFSASFPATVCVTELPPDLPEASDIREEFALPAFFFRVWAYRSEFIESFDAAQRQVSPLFIGRIPRRIDVQPADNPLVAYIVTGMLFGIVIAASLVFWANRRSRSPRPAIGLPEKLPRPPEEP